MIIAVSDWHLGFRDDWCPGMEKQPWYNRLFKAAVPHQVSGNAQTKQDAILSFLEVCAQSDPPVTDLVLLGDILDLWRRTNCEIFSLPEKYYHSQKNKGHAINYVAAKSVGVPDDPTIQKVFKNQEILRTLATMELKVHYVIGNHDYYLLRLQQRNKSPLPIEIKKNLRLTEGNTGYFFTHGYEMDALANYELFWDIDTYEQISERLCYSGNKSGSVLSYLYGTVEKLSLKTFLAERMIRKRTPGRMSRMLTPMPMTFTDLFAQSRVAFLMLGMKPDDVLVYGHTHSPYCDTNNRVVNTGSWCETCGCALQYPYVKIDGDDYSLNQFVRGTKKL